MTSSLEKVFFNYILNNKKFFEIVKPYFFKNSEIQTVYNVIRQYIILNSDAEKPTPRQIFEMVSLEDKEGFITKEILKSILTINMDEFDEKNFIEPRFNSWILSKRIQAGAIDILSETRDIENIHEFNQIVDLSGKIRKMAEDMSSTNFLQDDDMGSDFDDVESHVQDNSKLKVKTGFETLDHILGGGWDIGTLNCLMAETNGGKCTLYSSEIKILNKINLSEDFVKIGDLFNKISQESKDI